MTQQTTTLLPKEERPAKAALGWIMARSLLRDPVTFGAAVIFSLILFAAVGAEIIAPHDPLEQNLRLRNMPPLTPSVTENPFPHILGTDPLGRDLLSRILFGARVSLTVGLSSAIVSGLVGSVLGIIAGYYSGFMDDLIMRLVDVWMSMPVFLLALFVLFTLGPGFLNLVVVLALVRWMAFARLARGQTLTYRHAPFIEAAIAIGSSNARIIGRHIVPNLASPLVILGTLETATMILSVAGLSFLGFGIQPPQPSWGLMISSGRDYLTSAWWVSTFPGLMIFLTTLSLNLLAAAWRSFSAPGQRSATLRAT